MKVAALMGDEEATEHYSVDEELSLVEKLRKQLE
jgi:hypothetical protein